MPCLVTRRVLNARRSKHCTSFSSANPTRWLLVLSEEFLKPLLELVKQLHSLLGERLGVTLDILDFLFKSAFHSLSASLELLRKHARNTRIPLNSVTAFVDNISVIARSTTVPRENLQT